MTEKKHSKQKSRVSYEAGMRPNAKQNGVGLITISVQTPDGQLHEYQMYGNAALCRFAKLAGIALHFEEGRSALPEIEEIVRKHVEANTND